MWERWWNGDLLDSHFTCSTALGVTAEPTRFAVDAPHKQPICFRHCWLCKHHPFTWTHSLLTDIILLGVAIQMWIIFRSTKYIGANIIAWTWIEWCTHSRRVRPLLKRNLFTWSFQGYCLTLTVNQTRSASTRGHGLSVCCRSVKLLTKVHQILVTWNTLYMLFAVGTMPID